MHTEELRGLGKSFGFPSNPIATTFGDDGGIPMPSSLREAYGHILPTTLGFLAGAVRLLRDPYVVHALQVALQRSGRPVIDHLVSIFNANLAAVYGDEATLQKLAAHIKKVHQQTFPAAGQPDWFERVVRLEQDFQPYDPLLMKATTFAVAAAISRAHKLCQLVPDDDRGVSVAYGQDLLATIGRVAGVTGFSASFSTYNLGVIDTNRTTVPLMNQRELQQAGVPELLSAILCSTVDGQTVAQLSELFIGFTLPDDREALGLTWTDRDQASFDGWTKYYGQAAHKRKLGEEGELTDDQFFDVSFRGAVLEQ